MRLLAVLILAIPVFAEDFYAAADGMGTTCSDVAPCPLTYPIQVSNPKGLSCDDTLHLRGGTYTGAFVVAVSGSSTSCKVLIRNYGCELAVLDNASNVAPATLAVTGNYVRILSMCSPVGGIKVTNSETTRTHIPHLQCYPLCRSGGVFVSGLNVDLIHLTINDNGDGLASQSTGQGLMLYAPIIAYNGWQSSSRGHGHGLYLQNDSLTNRKTVTFPTVFWNFGYCGQFYGSSDAEVFGIDSSFANCWDNGRIATSSSGPVVVGLLVGGNAEAHDVTLTDSQIFARSQALQPRQMGLAPSYGLGTSNMTIARNYVNGGTAVVYDVSITGSLTCEDNEFFGTTSAAAQTQCTAMDGNTHSTYDGDSGATYWQNNSEYDPNWKRIVISNPDLASTVNITPDNCSMGDTFEVRYAMAWDAAMPWQTINCAAGQAIDMDYDGPINDPVGEVPNAPVATGLRYGTFFLTKIAGNQVNINTATLPEATQGAVYSAEIIVSGGTAPYTCTVTAGELPAGLMLTGCVISGTPSGTDDETFTVTAEDDAAMPDDDTQELTIVVNAATALDVTTSAMPNCPIGSAYVQPLAATGGEPPYTWSIVSGTLPAGLSLDGPTGAISGESCTGPVAQSAFTVRATDAAMDTNDQALTLNVVPAVLSLRSRSGSRVRSGGSVAH